MRTNTDWSEWPAPAKLNLFLRITGRRADGYHTLQTAFRLLDWGDTLRLRVRDDGEIGRVDGGGYGVAAEDDLAVRAARTLQAASESRLGCEIDVIKRIPLGGGFGGGSSDAATVLVALNCLWNAGLDTAELAALGLQLGADVPVFVHGHNAWAEGVGEILLPLPLAAAWYLLVDPGVHVPTAALFQSPDLTRTAAPVTIADFVRDAAPGSSLKNAFEPLLRRDQPAIAAALDALSRFGPARVTGSGGGCFVEFSNREAAQAALEALSGDWRAWIARGAERSPLLDRLDAMKMDAKD